MNKTLRPFLFACFLGISLFSCIKKQSPDEVRENLKEAMQLYLSHQPGREDTSKVKFEVVDVTYFEDKKVYMCEFKVNMKQRLDGRLIDTTGTMSAHISKDYKDVSRRD